MMKFALFILLIPMLYSITPQEAHDRLLEGNRHYVEDDFRSSDRSSYRRAELLLKQKPFAVIVGCSDSRVPPEIIFDQGLGDLFVVRVAGQVVGPLELDSIDYAAKYLGSSLVLVLGHESCGAVQAVLDGNTSDIEGVANLIQPAIKGIKKSDLTAAVKANVMWNVAYLKRSPLIKRLIQQGKLDVIGGYYTLEDGHIEILQ